MSSTRSESMTGSVKVSFPEYGQPPAEPVGLLRAWLADAARTAVREPRALALATADETGRPSTRIVVINQVTDTGFVFITHEGSRKGRELAANPWASGLLYWRETSQQIVVDGPVVKLSDAEAEAMWHARPVFTHAMTTASRQSEPAGGLDEVEALRERALELGGTGRPLPCPEGFAAYELRYASVEFWANGTDRLHERLRYDRDGEGWRVGRLQP
ncbi:MULTISPECIES: phenazine biosynthesis FMN-dependent oxidase PhzG [unclassified Streptomyces]|uniref:phenazine biosynthesis FMN-dependent oxidase PhzG n=1 Tax=unclassified Streptomyces TaxID=2593676 RepID=UPI002E2DA476|nr:MULTISPECIES: phenazine biosynthesis FMN-dependent oxidase PhzG [unclassified Streptomyces]